MELVINFSGGKDSCAMLAYICEKYPDVTKHVVFANTGWEHEGVEEWCWQIVKRFGLPFNIVKNANKNLLSMTIARGKFPSPEQRQCTSDLKRDPIMKWVRNMVPDNVVVNCMGLRAEESPARKAKRKLGRNKRESNSKRTIWDWLPIHDWSEEKVFSYLKEKGIPLHPVYSYLKRFSCRVCIYMSMEDLHQVKKYDPEAITIISKIERQINFSIKPGFFLDELDHQNLNNT